MCMLWVIHTFFPLMSWYCILQTFSAGSSDSKVTKPNPERERKRERERERQRQREETVTTAASGRGQGEQGRKPS